MHVTEAEREAIKSVRRFLLNDYRNRTWRISDEYSVIVPSLSKEVAEIRKQREQLTTVSLVLDRLLKEEAK